MNLLASNDFTFYLKNVFADWAIALFIFFAVLILLAVLFKGLKVGIILLIIAAAVAGGFVLAAFITMLVTWDTLKIIDFAIRWGPTILFVTIITVSTLVNAKRGLRKSLILLAQAVGAGVVCIIFYYVCANSRDVDKFILFIINTALNGNTLQNMLGVSSSCSTLREILVEYLPKMLGGDFQILLAANPQYIVTLADMAFRIVFSVITIVIYFLLVFLLYVIYFFAYPERRYKKKVNLAVTKNQTDRPYTKNHVGGGAVGLVRGITVGLLSLSFIGSALFMVAGGIGSGTLGNYDFDNDDYNYYYSIYRSIDSYGSQGIFKILNSMTDASDTPFYLFAADMVLSGNLDDEENGIDNQNIKFREEIAAYLGFAKDTLNLLLKYGEDDIVAILNGNGGDNAFDKIVNIMTIPEFRTEFDVLIREFDAQTYVINLGISLVNSIVDNIDDISFTSDIGEDNKELIKILFKKGHLSDAIPDERELKQKIEAGTVKPTDYEAPPRIKVSHLLNKDDIRLVLGVALSFISGEIKSDDAIAMVKSLLPDIKQLSILKTSRSGELDPVFARTYAYIENKYLTADGKVGTTYKAVANKNIKWLEEIHTLLDVADSALTLWNNIYDEKAEPLDIALGMFDPDNPCYRENVECFDNIRSALENSDIIGTVMSTSFMYGMLTDAFSAISKNIYIPQNLVFNRHVNADGSVVPGEMYNLFGGFKLLSSPQNRGLLDKALAYINGEGVDLNELLGALSDALVTPDDDGNSLSSYFTESTLLRSLLSIVMIEQGGDTLYVPKVSLDKLDSGETVNMINKRELKQLLDNLSVLVDFVQPLLEGNNDSEHIRNIAEYLQNEEFAALVEENRIYEGTVANLLSIFIEGNPLVVVPRHLIDSVDGWVTVIEDGTAKAGELRNLINALNLAGINLADIAESINGDDGGESAGGFDVSKIFNNLISMDRYEVQDFLKSQILHYTISKYLIEGTATGGFELIVPYGARDKTEEGDTIEYIVKESELISLFEAVASLELSDSEDLDISSVLYKVVVNKDIFDKSRIIAASVVYTITSSGDIGGAINIPENYLNAGTKTALLDYNSSNVWKAELPRFIDALDEILGISAERGEGESFEFNGDGIQDSLSELLAGLNKWSRVNNNLTKLQLCYLSDIARNEITTRLDDILLEHEIVPEEALIEAKSRGYYKVEELEALAAALEIFGIDDLLTLDSSEIIKSVTDMAFSLNDKVEGYEGRYEGRTALEVIYPSNIIQYIFSGEIDNALAGHIEPEVINYIKAGRKTYPQNEIAAFVDAINELGITEFGEDLLKDFTLDKMGNLEVIYASRIAAGVITKSLREALNSGSISDRYTIDHSKAYESGVRIYKFEEIQNIYNLFGDSNFNELSIGNIDLESVSDCLYDESEVTHSYLIASVVSAILKSNAIENRGFIIPEDVVDDDGCIQPKELAIIVRAFIKLAPEDKDFENLEKWEITEVPDKETRDMVFASVILRARMTYEFAMVSDSNRKSVYISTDCVTRVLDIKGEPIYIITADEFEKLALALLVLSGGEDNTVFEVPSFDNLEAVLSLDRTRLENELLQSDIILRKLSECLLDDPVTKLYLTYKGITVPEKRSINLINDWVQDMPVITADIILDVYDNIKSFG